MNWDAFGAVAEAIAALGVIASLLYLARQIRHASDLSEVQAKFRAVGLLSEYTSMLIEREDLNDLFVRGRRDFESLVDEAERIRFSNMCLRAFWFFSASHFQRTRGQIGTDEWVETETVLRFWIGGPGVQTWWARWGQHAFGERFGTYVNAEISRLGAAEMNRPPQHDRAEGET